MKQDLIQYKKNIYDKFVMLMDILYSSCIYCNLTHSYRSKHTIISLSLHAI